MVKKLLLLLILTLLPMGASAYDIAVENTDGVKICYNYINDGNELEVTNWNYPNFYEGVVNIPETVTYKERTRRVTAIGYHAFYGYATLTSVSIPNSVKVIGERAFYACAGLSVITLPSSVISIGKGAFIGCLGITSVISLIEEPFGINTNTFDDDIFYNVTLKVPVGTINKYKVTEGWKKFHYIEEYNGGDNLQKCSQPTISYNNGKLTYHCETEGATCQSTITDTDIRSYSGNEVQLTITYNISVYATKTGYDNSETATATLCWIDKEPTTEGITDGVAQISSKAVLIQSEGGILKVEGVDDGTQVSVYTPDGKQAGSAVSRNGAVLIGTSIQPGNTAIVKIGDRAVKVIVR